MGFEDYLKHTTGAGEVYELEVIQSLWSGYGKISRYRLTGACVATVVVKNISQEKAKTHPRGWNTDNSHKRKVRSYEVETHWYKHWSKQCPEECKIPRFLGSFEEAGQQWIVLEDLQIDYPETPYSADLKRVEVCVKWLANFHAVFLNEKPDGLWPVGTYWHLDTRPDEWEKIEHKELKANAHKIDELLKNCRYQTLVHGDAKLANFCFSSDGNRVAAVDFQYVGGGCGMKDLAYFFGSCMSGEEMEQFDPELLDLYFSELRKALVHRTDIDINDLEKEWRTMYPVAHADFIRFLLGWMPDHQKINGYNLNLVEEVLLKCSEMR